MLSSKVKTIIELIKHIGIRYETLLSYFRLDVAGDARLRSMSTYTYVVELFEQLMIDQDTLHRLIDELMTDHIKEISGEDISKIKKHFFKTFRRYANNFFKFVSFRKGRDVEHSSRIKFTGQYIPMIPLMKDLVFNLYKSSDKLITQMNNFGTLETIKGRGIEKGNMPRKFM